MIRSVRCALRGLAICALVLSDPAAAGSERPYTLDDMLKLEDSGVARTDPTGRWMVWEYAPPYERQPDYSVNATGTWRGAYQLMVVDVTERNPTSRPLFKPDPARQYWLDGFSPDGRFVVFYSAKHGRFDMGAYDLQTRRLQYFAPAPEIDWIAGTETSWISNDSFVYSALPQGDQPGPGRRRAYGERMQAAWEQSWQGKTASVTAVDSGPSPSLSRFKPGRLLKVDARTGKVETLAEGSYADIKLSPDGRFLAALRQANKAQPDPAKPDIDWTRSRSQLVLFDLQKQGAMQIVSPELEVFPRTLAWAADRNRLAYFAWPIGAGAQAGIFHALDAATGKVTPYAHTGLDLASERERGFFQKPERVLWIGDRLAMFARENPAGDATPKLTYRELHRPGEPEQKADWFLVDAAGQHENLTAGFKSVTSIPLYADARSLTVLADGGVWRLQPGAAPEQLGASIGKTLALTAKAGYGVANRAFAPAATLIARDEGGASIAFLDFIGRRITTIPAATAQVDPIAASPQKQAVLYRDVRDGTDAILLQRASAAPVLLYRLNRVLDGVARTTMTSVRYDAKTATGLMNVESCVLLPPDYQPGRRYPVIVDVYPDRGATGCAGPGLQGPTRLDGNPRSLSEHLWASLGYIYFKANLRRELIRRSDGPLDGMTDATLRGATALVEQGYADPDRIGLYGVSQGGFSSLWVATQTDRFKAVVSLNGWSDMYAHYFEATYSHRLWPADFAHRGSVGRYVSTAGTDFGIGKTPQQDPDAYVRNSPLFRADKIVTPLLLVHSDMDGFNLSQYETMFTALYQQRKEARLLQYWGEGHSPSSPANIRDLWREMQAWFDTHLDVARDKSGMLLWNGDRVQGRAKQ